jgi:hypothetical protein
MEALCSSKTSVNFYHSTSQKILLPSVKETIMHYINITFTYMYHTAGLLATAVREAIIKILSSNVTQPQDSLATEADSRMMTAQTE